jgi:tripartite-type tricarboxylate transporter receptor subunit TctC
MLMRAIHVLLLTLLTLPGVALAQSPQKTMTIIVPFAPGGSADGIARIVAAELGARLGRQVIVEGKPGAGGTVGIMALAKAPPDGDTLSVAATAALVINPHIPGAVAFDPLRELTPIAKLIDIPIVLVSNAKSGPHTIKEVIEKSKSKSDGLNFGTTGPTSGQRLAVELLKTMTGANLIHVPYRGSAPAVTAVLGEQIPLASVDLTSAHPQIQGKLLTALGVTSAKRAKSAPEIPTIAESVPGFDGSNGYIGLFAPAGTPAIRIKDLSRMVADILTKPDVQEKIALLSVEPAYLDDAGYGAMLAAESVKWREVLKSLPLQN